jgi:DnaJ family protein B protein 13
MDGLKQGANREGKEAGSGWIFQSNPREMFSQFFGHSSPFAEFSNGESMFMESRDLTPKKMPTLEANLYVSLEELNAGAIKKQKVTRQVLTEDMKTTKPEEKILTIDVQPGWKEGTRLTFPDAGDEGVGMAAGDIVLTLKEKPHPRFTRRKNDLVYNAKISLLQALVGCTVDVEMLDGRTLPIALDQIVSPGYVKVVPGEGLPFSKNPEVKGNLLIEFTVTYPSQLSIKAKEQLSLLLPP